jgi:hypothetical protein
VRGAARLLLLIVALLPVACLTQHLGRWAGGEVEVDPSASIEYPRSAWVEIKNVEGLADGVYRLGLDAKAMEADVQWRAQTVATAGHGSVSSIVGRMLYLGKRDFDWWGRTVWSRRGGPAVGDAVFRLDVDEHDVPIDPDHLRDTAKAGVAVVRSADREIRLILFEPATDGNGWTKIDEYPIGAGTQGSMRAVVFLVAIPVTAVLDLVTLPLQGIGCCWNYPG